MFNDIPSLAPVTNIVWRIHLDCDDVKSFGGPLKIKMYLCLTEELWYRLFLSHGGIILKKEDCWITKSLHYITGHQKYFTTENHFNWDCSLFRAGSWSSVSGIDFFLSISLDALSIIGPTKVSWGECINFWQDDQSTWNTSTATWNPAKTSTDSPGED